MFAIHQPFISVHKILKMQFLKAPEKRLIENSEAPIDTMNLQNPSQSKALPQSIRQRKFTVDRHKRVPWQKRLTALLYLVSAGLIIYLVILIITTPIYIRRMKESVPQAGTNQTRNLPAFQELSAYLDIVAKHPAFGVIKATTPVPTLSACDEFKSKYVLTGIVGGAENEAVFNSKMGQQSYFGRPGETIEGVLIESVESDKVVIDCSGKKVEIIMEGA